MVNQIPPKNYQLIKAKFIEYLADPTHQLSQEEFAQKEGVNPATLSEWKSDNTFQDNLRNRINELLGDELPKIYQVIKRKALEGDFRFVELFLKQINALNTDKAVNYPEIIVVNSPVPRSN